MFEKLTKIAEHTATNASRRQFLGRLGRAAAAAAGVLGGLLLAPRDIRAGGRSGGPHGPNKCINCSYICPDLTEIHFSRSAGGCPGTVDDCQLFSAQRC
jgi:hypothetical protein